jgi:8-oxo-dGTP pyrophosphatase MutT (NUDIX family)
MIRETVQINQKGVIDMLLRNCAGGVVFSGNKVFLLKNEKGEWVFPKGVIKNGELQSEVALKRVKEEGGIDATIISTAGRTNYEFFSVTRQQPVCNRITWFIMMAPDQTYSIGEPTKFLDAGFFTIEEAMEKITYSQDRSLLHISYMKYKELISLAS